MYYLPGVEFLDSPVPLYVVSNIWKGICTKMLLKIKQEHDVKQH